MGWLPRGIRSVRLAVMTEPTDALEPEAFGEAVGEASGETVRDAVPSWPELPSRLPTASTPVTGPASGPVPGQAAGPETRDPAVDALLERLGALPSMPVSGHGEAYRALHDELLEALNADVEGQLSAPKISAGRSPAGQASAGQGNAAPVMPDHSVGRGQHDDQA